jgi:leucyl-tRNA synthetase
MFLGPLQDSKPWDTHGIEGVFKFLNKLWKLYDGVEDSEPHQLDLTTLHKTIKKVQSDIENLSFNTSVSAFMICVNELSQSNCNSKSILSDLAIIISPFAPHIAEEIWEKLGNKESISFAAYPGYDEEYLQQDTYVYPVSFNGKVRFKIELSVELSTAEIESEVLEHDISKKWLDGSPPKRVIVVPQRIVNVVI